MPHAEVMLRLQKVFDQIFLDEVNVTPELTADDVEEWNSLLHVSLVMAVEEEFGIRFRVGEVETAANVGQLADLIEKRMEKK